MTSSQRSAQGPSTAPPLRPELGRVLGSLTVHLEDELLRYRRQIRGQAPIPTRRIQPAQSNKPLDLISVPSRPTASSMTEGRTPATPPRRPGQPTPPPPPPNPFLKRSAPAALLADDLAAAQSPSTLPNAPLASPPDASTPTQALAGKKNLADNIAALSDSREPAASTAVFTAGLTNSTVVEDAAVEDAAVEDAAVEDAASGAASDVESPLSDSAAGDYDVAAADPDVALKRTASNPDGYLESSEALLKSLADDAELPPTDPEERPPTPYNPNAGKSSLPLKLGTLLLLLTASAAVGYAIINPTVLDPARNWIAARVARPESAETPVPADAASSETEQRDFSPPGPDLSSREFVELDLDQLSTLDVDGAAPRPVLPSNPLPTPSADSNTAAPPATTAAPAPNPSTSAPQTLASSTPTPSATAPVTPTPAASTAAAAPAAPSASPATGSNYYVVTAFTGDAALNKAREVVSDAFVRNFSDGTYVQVAAFDNPASAQAQVQELQQRGLTVQLYGPTDE